jgi:HNH endonuclease
MAWVDGRGERLPPHKILISALGGKCEKCGAAYDLQIHHRVPLAAGGTNQLSNLAVLCRVCHGKETAAFAKLGHLRGSDWQPSRKRDSTRRRGRSLPGEDIGEPHWFEGTELFRFDDKAALAHLWRTTTVSPHWKLDTIQKRHDQRCPLADCPLRGKGVISLIERQSNSLQ